MSQVNLILVEGVHNLGEAGDLVSVKPGFARNFLLRQGKAILATESRVKELQHHKRVVADKVARDMKNLEAAKNRLEGIPLETTMRAGEVGKLFGSVTAANVVELLAEKGFEVDRRRIQMDPIKEVGQHEVTVRLHRDVLATVKLTVLSEAAPPPEETVDPDDVEVED